MLIVALGLVVSACGGGSGASGDSAQKSNNVSLLISFQDGPVFYPFAVARKLGYFQQEGLSVKIQATEGSSFVTQQLLAGKIDYGLANAPADIIAYTKDPNIRVASCYRERNSYEIVVLKGKGIDVHSVADLKGKVLGTTRAGSGEYPYAQAALRAVGLVPDKDVKLAPIGDGTPATRQAMESHKVDAYISEHTRLRTMTEQWGMNFENITPSSFTRTPGTCFVTKKSTLDDPEKRKEFVGISRAFVKGTIFGMANKQAAVEIVCSDIPQTCQDREVALQQVEDNTELAQPMESSTPVGGIDQVGWEAAADVAYVSGQTSQKVDVTPIIESPEVKSATQEILKFDLEQIRQSARDYHA
jgi:NitT/TauT family transport system substrate-binding protein